MSEDVVAPPPAHRSARSRAATRALWQHRRARFPSSGLTGAQFCALEAVSVPSFSSWRRRLTAAALGTAAPHLPGTDPAPRLLPVRLASAHATVELVRPGGAVLRVPPGADLALVRALIEALGDVSCCAFPPLSNSGIVPMPLICAGAAMTLHDNLRSTVSENRLPRSTSFSSLSIFFVSGIRYSPTSGSRSIRKRCFRIRW
jgi:hypothetical protein